VEVPCERGRGCRLCGIRKSGSVCNAKAWCCCCCCWKSPLGMEFGWWWWFERGRIGLGWKWEMHWMMDVERTVLSMLTCCCGREGWMEERGDAGAGGAGRGAVECER
jgi:hypothetical protein